MKAYTDIVFAPRRYEHINCRRAIFGMPSQVATGLSLQCYLLSLKKVLEIL